MDTVRTAIVVAASAAWMSACGDGSGPCVPCGEVPDAQAACPDIEDAAEADGIPGDLPGADEAVDTGEDPSAETDDTMGTDPGEDPDGAPEASDEGPDAGCIAGVPCWNTTPAGTCKGVTKCTDAGSQCDAAEPQAEQWNGLDDDCNGVVDDGVPVTVSEVTGAAQYVAVAPDPKTPRAFVAFSEGTQPLGWGQALRVAWVWPGEQPVAAATFGAEVFGFQAESAMQVGSDGTVQVMWHVSGSFDEEMAHVAIPAYGGPGPAERITDQPQINCDFPHLRLDATGAIHTIFAAEPGGLGISNLFYLKLAYDPANRTATPLLGGKLGIPLTEATVATPERRGDIALDGSGNPSVVYREGADLRYVRLDGSTGQVTDGPVTVMTGGFDSFPMLSMGPGDDLHLVVVQAGVAMHGSLALDGTLVKPLAAVSGAGADSPGVLVGPDGRVTVFWIQLAPGGAPEVFRRAVDQSTGGAIGDAAVVTPDDGVASTYKFPWAALAVDPAGTIHLAWEEHPVAGGSRIVYERVAPQP
jgi:hypothetical protein